MVDKKAVCVCDDSKRPWKYENAVYMKRHKKVMSFFRRLSVAMFTSVKKGFIRVLVR